ncbi:hypothetical protein ATEIFO6365_0005029400 [Aspergillus terreus]|uniref:Uncharacterized protein n=1 Tax=Aspergillus terreus TaxID=33178 RepID=A0A5M3Z0X9_ASPTE|nr:hypothetical protein ATETN484_0007029900 [Aspergillus terreus]GFF16104.1 hypothetical protein ATEIFO6365_0005029400 [Aspergillus terreus]
MTTHEPLHGSCLCGRNQYIIRIPQDQTSDAQIYFDTSRDNRRFHGTPLTAWLRVPLTWYQSHTQSYFPDETHGTIRRIFSPHHAPHTQRVFCGFCGTPLSYWSEHPREEADYMSVTVGSLDGNDQRLLEDLDLLPESSSEEEVETEASPQAEQVTVSPAVQAASSTVAVPSSGGEMDVARSFRQGTTDGIPWFEEMIEGSRLGRLMKTRRGIGMSDDQSTRIEWEISEWTNDGSHEARRASSIHAPGKRKRGHHTSVEDA